jgi:predicted dehydrogenase
MKTTGASRSAPPEREGQPLRCAIVGLGRIGAALEADSLREKPCTHAGAIAANPDCRLNAGCDIDGQARERFQADWNAPVYADLQELLERERPHILVAAAYPEVHRRIVERAAAAGVPVIVCEKPLARSLRDARAIARIHRRGEAKILVNHERRYSRDYLAARQAVTEERYGRLLSVKGTLCFGASAPRREVLLHDGTHMIDAINFLAGTPLRLRRRFGTMRGNSFSAFLCGRCGRLPVLLEVGSERDHLVFELELGFQRGRIKVGNGLLSFEVSAESPYYEGYRSLLSDEAPVIEATGYFAGMITDAVRCAREPEHMPRSSAEDALAVMRCIKSLPGWR